MALLDLAARLPVAGCRHRDAVLEALCVLGAFSLQLANRTYQPLARPWGHPGT